METKTLSIHGDTSGLYEDRFKLEETIEKKLGRVSDGAGFGMGEWDLSYYAIKEKEVKAFEKVVEKMFPKEYGNGSVSVTTYSDEQR